MYCVLYIDKKVYIGDIADQDETRYLISVAKPDVYNDDYDPYDESFGPDCLPSDQYQTPRFIMWKNMEDVIVYETKEECDKQVSRLINLQ